MMRAMRDVALARLSTRGTLEEGLLCLYMITVLVLLTTLPQASNTESSFPFTFLISTLCTLVFCFIDISFIFTFRVQEQKALQPNPAADGRKSEAVLLFACEPFSVTRNKRKYRHSYRGEVEMEVIGDSFNPSQE